ncbi:hypothetical protein ACTQ5F_04490 [Jeotgalibaca porci]|uniref:hypothetical protein n=1 Tax=Jeotgalibaca porci TaxID=1868793 RepID=UPI003F8F9FFD
MLMKNSDLRRQGRENLRGNYLVSLANFSIISVIGVVLQSFYSPEFGNSVAEFTSSSPVLTFILSMVTSFIMALLMLGLHWGFLDIQDGEQMTVGHIFLPYKYNPMKVVSYTFRKQLWITLWSLLFIVPGVIKTYAWAMSDYIYYEEPELLNREILAKSEALMQGHKWRLFRLEFYYALIYLLPVLFWMAGLLYFGLTVPENSEQWMGIGFIWIFAGMFVVLGLTLLLAIFVEPRRNSARAAFYTHL